MKQLSCVTLGLFLICAGATACTDQNNEPTAQTTSDPILPADAAVDASIADDASDGAVDAFDGPLASVGGPPIIPPGYRSPYADYVPCHLDAGVPEIDRIPICCGPGTPYELVGGNCLAREVVVMNLAHCMAVGDPIDRRDLGAGVLCCKGAKPIELADEVDAGVCQSQALLHMTPPSLAVCASCGNGVCESDVENRCNCPEDCGRPPDLPGCLPAGTPINNRGGSAMGDACCFGVRPIAATQMVNGKCTPSSSSVCASCGDGKCEGVENHCNCPADCF